jgi:hydrogenase nickel incorporation protein HypA/HybF
VHELSLADAIVTIAREHADDRRVTRVEVTIGHLRQVVPDALRFAFELVATGTNVEGASLNVEAVPARVLCMRCESESEARVFPLACRRCGGVDVEIVAGDELLVEALELEDEPIGRGAACGTDGNDAWALPARPSETSTGKGFTFVGGRYDSGSE